MKWDELSDKDKVKLILTHVIPHSINDNIVFKNNHIDFVKRGREAPPFDYPIAAWDDFLPGIWWTCDIGDNGDTAFNPLHDMNDAWQIVDCAKFAGVRVERLYKTSDERKYVCQIVSRRDDPYASIPIRAKTDVFGRTAQEAICKAALKAVGLDIE